MKQDNPNEWKVGDNLFCDGYMNAISKNKIVRETQTTFVLDDGNKIRKGNNRIIGSDSFFGGVFYSEKSDYGATLKRKYERITLEKEIRRLPLETFHVDKLKKILEVSKQ